MPSLIRKENERNSRHSLSGRQQEQNNNNDNQEGGGRKRPRRNKSAPPTSTITVQNSTASSENNNAVLLQLSHCCNLHRDFHSSNRNSNDGGIHQKCQDDLGLLKKLLPKVEKKYRYRPLAKASKYKEPDAIEVMQLCMFYRDVLGGGYCPHAAALFQTITIGGAAGTPNVHEVLLRVHYLFQQLTCPKIIAHTKSGKTADEQGEEFQIQQPSNYKTCHFPSGTTWIIEKTITHLLTFLASHNHKDHHPTPTQKYYATLIQQDLYQLLMDLAVLSEYVEEQESSSNSNSTEEIPSVQISLFPQISAAMAQPNNDYTTTSSVPEYLLDVILQKDVVWSLQGATLNALAKWQELRHDVNLTVVQIPESGDSQLIEGGYNIRSNNGNITSSSESESRQTLLASLRPILLGSSVSALAERARSAALELLLQPGILTDMDYSLLLETSSLIVHGVGAVLLRRQQWKQYAANSNSPHPTTQSHDVLYNLMVLLRKTVLFPPSVPGYTESQVKSMLWGSLLTPLLELCLPWIRPAQRQESGASKTVFQKLEEMVLRTIHVCVMTDDNSTRILVGNAKANEIVTPLLELMKDTHLSPIAVSILKALWKPMDIAELCELTWTQQQQDDINTPTIGFASLLPKIPPAPSTPYPEELVGPANNIATLGLLSPTAKSPSSMTSPRPKGSATKGSKRRPSLLGENPLTFRSPMPTKRPRKETTPSGSPHHPQNMNNSAQGSNGCCFVEDLIQTFLLQGLQSAKAISDYINSLNEGATMQPGKLIKDAGVVSGCIRFLLSQCPSTQEPQQERAITAHNDDEGSVFLAHLVECWQSLSTLVYDQTLSSQSHAEAAWTLEWQSLAELVVNCGLHFFHHVESTMGAIVSPVMDAVFRESCFKCCAALASMARVVMEEASDDSFQTAHDEQKQCHGSCRGFSEAWAIETTHGFALLASPDLCVCDLTIQGRSGEEGESDNHMKFQLDCTLMTICSLPLSSRCCLLAAFCQQKSRTSLHPPMEDSFGLPPTWLSLQHEYSPFRLLLEAKPLEWNNMTRAAMVLAPLQIVTSCLDPDELDRSGEQKSHLGMVLNDFLRSVILPAIDTIQQQDDAHWQYCAGKTLGVVMRQIQRLHLLLDENRAAHQPAVVKSRKRFWKLSFSMEFLRQSFEMDLRTSDGIDWNNPNSGACDGLRREVAFRLTKATDVEGVMTDENSLTLAELTPSARLLRWKCVAWECLRLVTAVDLKQLVWLVRAPFSDPDEMVRNYTSRELGKVLLTNDGLGMHALFSDLGWRDPADGGDEQSTTFSLDEGATFDETPGIAHNRQRDRAYSDRVVSTAFNEFDSLVGFYCEEAYMNSPTGAMQRAKADHDQRDRQSRQISAVRVFSSLCHHANLGTAFGKSIVEQALLRLVRLLAVSSHVKSKDRDFYNLVSPAASFSELERLSRQSHLRERMVDESSPDFVGNLVCNCLLPSSSLASSNEVEQGIDDIRPAFRERRYFRLYHAVCAILVRTTDRKLTCLSGGSIDIQPFLDQVLPGVLAHIVHRNNYDSLRLFAGFAQHFVKEVKKKHGRARLKQERACKSRRGLASRGASILQRQEGLLGDAAGSEIRPSAVAIPTSQLEDEIVQLCLGFEVLGRLLPAVFMNSNQSNLLFFRNTALQGKHTLQELITTKEQPIIKALCGNLGGDPADFGLATHALKAAAIVLRHEPEGSTPAVDQACRKQDPDFMASQWVTSHFMYLVVNVVQYKWKIKSDAEKLQSMRCLNAILGYLQPSDAPQYFPQILATVNVANEEGSDLEQGEESRLVLAAQLRLLAISALSRFCRIVEQDGRVCLGQNLTSIVVSLIPSLSEQRLDLESVKVRDLVRQTEKAAVVLLTWLTQGDLGKELASYFKEIPFLPTSSLLDNVRANLKMNGVDFDNLFVMTQSTQNLVSSKETLTSGGSLDGKAAAIMEGKKQTALSKRIDTVCSLCGNENVSIRRVVLEHLLNLLRANRSLFHSLVAIEGSSSMGRFLTKTYPAAKDSKLGADSSFSVTKMMETLMARCVLETDAATKSLLGACLGEVGAIGEHRLGLISMSKVLGTSDSLDQSATSWRLSQPPWKSQVARYELQLVKRHLVVALKAAPSSSDQHKIAFAIQQLLQLLDSSAQDGGSLVEAEQVTLEGKPAMGGWLKGQLTEAGVYETVEPFWSSEFGETENRTQREPPFFQVFDSYFMWLSYWVRFMIARSNSGHNDSRWKALFHSLRTAIKAPVGLTVAEFILPLLVLDRLCFGDLRDKDSILQEMQDVFTCNQKGGSASRNGMSQPDKRKAVNIIFNVIETWQCWTDAEKEENQQQMSASPKPAHNDGDAGNWSADDCLSKIEEVLVRVPMLLQAEAAASVGMQARALRILEMAAREKVVERVFNASSADIRANSLKCRRGCSVALGDHVLSGVDLKLMKDVLADLNNCETMAALEESNIRAEPRERTLDSIRQNEASGNWEAASRDYERIQQLRGSEHATDPKLQLGALRCLLELGQFESVLNQVNGIGSPGGQDVQAQVPLKAMLAKPYAVEAAWRLGRWDTLATIVEQEVPSTARGGLGPDSVYQISHGEAILGLQKRSVKTVRSALDAARQAVMDSLSSVARESYSRAYPYLVRLQCLREMEDAMESICDPTNPTTFVELTKSDSRDGWSWQRRLQLVSPSGSAAVINTRLSLARLAKDPAIEGSLFLTVGKKARKAGLFNIAADSLAQAETVLNGISRCDGTKEVDGMLNATRMQLAKLKHDSGHSSAALKMLGHDEVQHLFALDGRAARSKILSKKSDLLMANETDLEDDVAIDRFSRRVLQSTHWIVAGGLKDPGEIIKRFRLIQEVAPEMEKGHFHYAKYIDSVIQSRVSALMSHPQTQKHTAVDEDRRRADAIHSDRNCQDYILIAMEGYIESLKASDKHVYHALPRLLSLWFEVTGITTALAQEKTASSSNSDRKASYGSRRHSSTSAASKQATQIRKVQSDANQLVEQAATKIPTRAFYTAMPQLISQIMHSNNKTASIVFGILVRVLARYPEQAMWPLAWLQNSKNSRRKEIGGNLFSAAAKICEESGRKQQKKILSASNHLINHLHQLAMHEAKNASRKGTKAYNPWRGKIPLCDFIPPVQAALTAVLPPSNDNASSKDLFPRQVPRMRDFNPVVRIMNSKARPKQITFFVIPAANAAMVRLDRNPKVAKSPIPGDAGEIHFLLKQEAKGDLRKDARVQDLNTVINRLMASSCNSSRGESRQLRLRTFAVTCLSEYTGILEWVPDTTAMRRLVESAYNPQADRFNSRGRGHRITDFSNAVLRSDYEQKCQDEFFKNGNLALAASNFEALFLREYPPVFYWWFVKSFPDPHAWYEARTNFTLSAAAWSGVGHVIGLGDRHSENVLIDTTTGECVHVDFDCIFDKGLNLPRPEIVPFRLTGNMVDAFGPTGADGVYSASLKLALGTLRHHRDTLLSVLEPFIKDPIIDWKRTRGTQSPAKKSSKSRGVEMTQVQDLQTRNAKNSIKVCDERLRGIYNLRNPNTKYQKKGSCFTADPNDELTQLLPLSVEGQCHKLIAEATSSENLAQLYVGWMSWC